MPEQFEQWGEIWDRWDRWLIRNNEEALRACISFPMSFQEIDRIIVGSVELEQLKQIILSANIGMSECPLPDLRCNDENLINPTKWPALKVYKS